MTRPATSTISKAAPKRRQTGWIGVDVGTSALKFAQVESVGGKWVLATSLIVPTGGGEAGLPKSVCGLLSETPAFKGRRAACVLPASATDFRTLELPAGSDDEVREMVLQELAMSGGFSASQCEFDFWELGLPRQGAGTRTYAVLSVSRDLARRAADDLLRSRLTCEALDGIPFALARAMAIGQTNEAGPVAAAIDWGYTSVTFVVAVEGRPVFVRSLRDCGLGLIEARLCAEFGLTPAECRPLLVNYGMPHPDEEGSAGGLPAVIRNLATEPLACLVEELSKTLSFAERQLRGHAPQSLVLFGGGATIRNVSALLAQRLGRTVTNWQMPTRTAARSNRRTALMGAAAGLSLLGCRE